MSKEVQISMTYKVFGADDYEEARQYIGQEGYFTDYPDDLEYILSYNRSTLEKIILEKDNVVYDGDNPVDSCAYFILPVK